MLHSTLHLGIIDPAPGNTHGIEVCICDEGCILPKYDNEKLGCPKGHPGLHIKWHPTKAVVREILEKNIEISDHICSPDVYLLLGDVNLGSNVELTVRRLRVDDDPTIPGFGLIHWHPVYLNQFIEP